MSRVVPYLLLLSAVWLLWSGHTEPLILGFGAASIAVVTWLAMRMGGIDHEQHPYHLSWRPLRYLPWLAKEIVLSNLHVARVILSPSLPISPRLVRVRASQRTDVGRVIYANSITITPGTVSLDVRDGNILVHCLTETTAAGLQSGDMDKQVAWLEGNA